MYFTAGREQDYSFIDGLLLKISLEMTVTNTQCTPIL
jgi:hypothetical protein